MTFIIGLLMKTGLGRKAAGAVFWIGVVLLIALALLWLRADAYQDGVHATDAKWEAAQRKLERQAEEAAGRADSKAAERVEAQNDRVAREKEKIDEAERNGDSPLDVLFGPSGL